jgi:hypothetical protein
LADNLFRSRSGSGTEAGRFQKSDPDPVKNHTVLKYSGIFEIIHRAAVYTFQKNVTINDALPDVQEVQFHALSKIRKTN